MKKPTVYRKTGMLSPKECTRSFLASQLREWRKASKVRRYFYSDAVAYQPEDKLNPYVALISR